MLVSPHRRLLDALSLHLAGAAVALAGVSLAPAPHAQQGPVVFEAPPAGGKDRAPFAPAAVGVLEAGNGVYRVYLADASTSTCGTWTARTGPLHEAGPNLNVLYGNGNPSTSDTTFRSYSSGTSYRTGGRQECTRLCAADAPSVLTLFQDGVATGFRMTWSFLDRPGQVVRFVQEVNVEGPVDGSETVDNTAIRETHEVHNEGTEDLEYGLRKQWDWQIAGDDGPWFGDCQTPDRACDRSMDFFEDGSGAGDYPQSYVINEDPAIAECPPGIVPDDPSGCDGTPVYVVAGTVSGPPSLTPPPDAPRLLEFNSWPRLVQTCWLPDLQDAAPCGSFGSPNDDTAVAYFYGLTAASAEVLGRGETRSYTQYVTAGATGCPSILEPTDLSCDAGGPYAGECVAGGVSFGLDATVFDGPAASLSWTTTCAGGTFDDATIEDPTLTIDAGACATSCSVTLTATSDDGQVTSCSASVTLDDTAPPALSCPGTLSVDCSDGGARSSDPAIAAWLAAASATDACAGVVAVTNDMPSFVAMTACPTTRPVTFTADDGCGNVATCVRTLTIVDESAPALTCPDDSVLECSDPAAASEDAWLASASAFDGCDGDVEVSTEVLSRQVPCEDAVIETVEFAAVDACGNRSACTRQWIVRDETAPTLSGVPADTVAACDAVPPPAAPAASDDCDTEPQVGFSEVRVDGPCEDTYTLVRTWEATDRCGNVSPPSTQHVAVSDTQAPVLGAAPAAVLVACGAVPPPATLGATDDCDPDPDVVFSEVRTDGSCPDSYTLTRTWTAEDRCGNVSSVSQVITVQDTQAPVLDAAPAAVLAACGAVPAPATLGATDDCDPDPDVVFSEVRTDGACPDSYTLTRTWHAEDRCGNASSVSQVVTVEDTQAPVLDAAPAAVLAACGTVFPRAAVGATDDCDPDPDVTFTEVRTDGACPDSYTLTRTWRAEDRCGNVSTVTQVVTVEDTRAPVLAAVPAAALAECDAVPAPATLDATDDCDPDPDVVFTEIRADGRCPDSYTLTRTWRAEDRCGNAASVSQLVTVEDTTPPQVTAPADERADCDAVPPPGSPLVRDNCDPLPQVAFAERRIDGPCPHSYVLVRTWSATDRCGNVGSASQRVTVVDETPPALSVPSPLVLECTGGGGVAGDDPRIVAWLARASATDDCSGPLPVDDDAPAFFPVGCPDPVVTTITFTSVDECGNGVAATSTVEVVDTTPPVIDSIDLPGCLWAPNHRYACVEDLALRVIAHDACSDELRVFASGCESDQPDEAPEAGDRGGRALGNGDGHHADDCVVAPDGSAFCLRAERQGTDRTGRDYRVIVVVEDRCGNRATQPWTIHVPHDQREHDCEKLPNAALLAPHDPFPW